VKDLIKAVEEIWNDPERMKEREKLLAEMEKKGEIERIDDALLYRQAQDRNGNWSLDQQV
jgi:hypothetical protein